jgi:hypothetical protein
MKSITQIVPRLPPAVDGLGDYAVKLAEQLHKDFRIETHFVVGEPGWRGTSALESFPISQVSERSAATLLSSLSDNSAAVLLHYVGYGYDKRGCPRWLVEGLEHWKRRSPERVLITMFHEVYASGPLWTSSFWLSPTQRNLAARLSLISNRSVTNREGYAEILMRLSRGKCQQIPILPVFSNVGEPDQMPLPLMKRRRRLVVFGKSGHRLLVFQKSLNELKKTCHALGIEEVFDVGSLVDHGITNIGSIPVTRTGMQPAHRVSEIFSNAIAGFFNYPTNYLGKSTIFAAYCAHRMLPIGVYCNEQNADGLQPDHHFWLADRHESEWRLAAAQSVADNAHNWYQNHNLSKQVEIFAEYLTASTSNRIYTDTA